MWSGGSCRQENTERSRLIENRKELSESEKKEKEAEDGYFSRRWERAEEMCHFSSRRSRFGKTGSGPGRSVQRLQEECF